MNSLLPRCEAVPLDSHQASLQVYGLERTRWHFGPSYPRPFFYPFIGPSGSTLTRIGHPGAPSHDHHRSIWFAHADVNGVDFWAEGKPACIRQKEWLCYEDGEDEAVLAVKLGWYSQEAGGEELLEQELVAALRPGQGRESFLELQSTFRAVSKPVELGQTNFGFLAVRVSKSLSEHFGGGELTNSEGAKHEDAIFGTAARWVDTSGPVRNLAGAPGSSVIEGVTFFDHPSNLNHPAHWHVRSDGWMGASVCMNKAITVTEEQPLCLRYLLHAHAGPISAAKAEDVAKEFARGAPFIVSSGAANHRQYAAVRAGRDL